MKFERTVNSTSVEDLAEILDGAAEELEALQGLLRIGERGCHGGDASQGILLTRLETRGLTRILGGVTGRLVAVGDHLRAAIGPTCGT